MITPWDLGDSPKRGKTVRVGHHTNSCAELARDARRIRTVDPVLIAEDLLLLLTDDSTGKPVVAPQSLTFALAGAVLVELALAGRVAVTDDGRWGSGTRVAVVSEEPLGEPVLDEALTRVVAKISAKAHPVGAQSLLATLGKGLADTLRHRLAQRGILREQEGRTLGIFPTRVWPAADARHEAGVRSTLWKVVVGGREPSEREVCLISLLHAVDQVPKQFADDGMSARQLRERAKALSEGNLGGDTVRRAIAATNAAVIAAVTASTAAASATVV